MTVLDFSDISSPELDSQAAVFVAAGTVVLSYVENTSVSSLRMDGLCARCLHPYSQTAPLGLPTSSIRGGESQGTASAGPWADFFCECGEAHPGAPDGVKGCGANYSIANPSTAGA